MNLKDALDEALDICGGKTGPDATDYFLARQLGAADEGQDWAVAFTMDAEREKAQRLLKHRARERNVVLVTHNGEILTKSARGGVRSHDDTAAVYFQQTLFSEMTWEQVYEWAAMQQSIWAGVDANRTIAKRLKALQTQAPDSTGPGDAASMLGTTLDEWLSA